MDKKTKIKILECISHYQLDSEHTLDDLVKEFPELQKDEIRSTLQNLRAEHLITCSLENGTAESISPTLRAIGYLREQAEIEEKDRAAKKRDIKKGIIIGVISGAISGSIVFLLKWCLTGTI